MRYNSALTQTELEFDSGAKGDMLSFGGLALICNHMADVCVLLREQKQTVRQI